MDPKYQEAFAKLEAAFNEFKLAVGAEESTEERQPEDMSNEEIKTSLMPSKKPMI